MKLGKDPNTGLEVLLMRGPYGFYAQLGPTDPEAKTKPKRAAWPKNVPIASADLDTALKLLALPRQLGNHPESGKPVEASIGPFGPYIKHDGGYKSIPKADSVHDIGLQRAVELLAAAKTGRGMGGKQLGLHPEDQKPVVLMSGRYGPYVKHARTNATVTQDYDPEKLTFQEALELLQAKLAKTSGSKLKKATPKEYVAAAKTKKKSAPSAREPAPANTKTSGKPLPRPQARVAARPAAAQRKRTKTGKVRG